MADYRFFLNLGYDSYEIPEPQNFLEIQSVLKRDEDAHGVFFEFSDGNVELEFSGDGRDILEAEYDQRGIDAEVEFEIQRREDKYSAWYSIYSANVDFTTRVLNRDFLKCTTQKDDILQKIKNRLSTPVAMNAPETLDGLSVFPLLPNEIGLHSQQLIRSVALTNNATETGKLTTAGTGTFYGIFSFDGGSNEVRESFSYPLQINADTPQTELKYLHKLTESGSYEVQSIELNTDFDVTNISVFSRTVSYDCTLYVAVGSLTRAISTVSVADTISALQTASFNLNFVTLGKIDLGLLDAGDEVYFYLLLDGTTSGGAIDLELKNPVVKYNARFESEVPGSSAAGYKIHEAMDRALELVTGLPSPLYSTILGRPELGYSGTGCLSDLILSNGYQIRNFEEEDKPIKFSLKQIFDSLNTIFGIGYALGTLEQEPKTYVLELKFENEVSVSVPGNQTDKFSVGDVITIETSTGDNNGSYTVTNVLVAGNRTFLSIAPSFTDPLGTVTSVTYPVQAFAFRNTITNIVRLYFYIIRGGFYYETFYDVYTSEWDQSSTTPLTFAQVIAPRGVEVYLNNYRYDTIDIDTITPITGTITNTSEFVRKSIIRLEEWEYFYSGAEIIDLGTVEDYEEETDTDFIANEVSIGFNKFADDENESNTLYDFHTEARWLMPVRQTKKLFEVKSPFIMSGYLIEFTRREQYSQEPTKSWKYDDDVFLISTDDVVHSGYGRFDSYDNVIWVFETSWNKVISFGNNRFTVSGTANNDGTYTYDPDAVTTFKAFGFKWYIIPVNEPIVESWIYADGITYTNPDISIRAETDDNFESVKNVPSAGTTYNLRYTLRRAFLNWGVMINSMMRYKPISEVIRNTFYKNNGALTTRFDEDEGCLLGDVERGELREDSNFQISQVQYGETIFEPNLITFKKKLSQAAIDLIRDAMNGALKGYDQDKNYGFIRLKEPTGEVHNAYILEMKWNISDLICTFKCRKRRISIYDVLVSEAGYVLLENGSVVLLENDGGLLIES